MRYIYSTMQSDVQSEVDTFLNGNPNATPEEVDKYLQQECRVDVKWVLIREAMEDWAERQAEDTE